MPANAEDQPPVPQNPGAEILQMIGGGQFQTSNNPAGAPSALHGLPSQIEPAQQGEPRLLLTPQSLQPVSDSLPVSPLLLTPNQLPNQSPNHAPRSSAGTINQRNFPQQPKITAGLLQPPQPPQPPPPPQPLQPPQFTQLAPLPNPVPSQRGKKKSSHKEQKPTKWAWSSFQNSPDPKSLPMPPCFSPRENEQFDLEEFNEENLGHATTQNDESLAAASSQLKNLLNIS